VAIFFNEVGDEQVAVSQPVGRDADDIRGSLRRQSSPEVNLAAQTSYRKSTVHFNLLSSVYAFNNFVAFATFIAGISSEIRCVRNTQALAQQIATMFSSSGESPRAAKGNFKCNARTAGACKLSEIFSGYVMKL
jgi:hypothetical protein